MIDTPPVGGPYNPAKFWATVGDWYESTCDMDGYRVQEDAIAAILEPLEWNSVLDMGCGFGRLGMMINRIRPRATYNGIDVCLEMLQSAKRHLPRARVWHSAILDFSPLQRWDLVISAEVLMHQPAGDIRMIINRMRFCSSRWILNCDWDSQTDPGNSWNIPHDYRRLWGKRLVSATWAGIPNQTIFLSERVA